MLEIQSLHQKVLGKLDSYVNKTKLKYTQK